ncbi:Lrp/AsnC family transcriptional regulator [Amycolatopsis regifaucium]|uniref:AsnC family transcriptional regulator n=1 Tax=Amycolatopsis regifaucium TaxID=546365 RepID=A0A154M557_9PSEU|nr:AsnC family transcriptional regulator [Amycolatopsis regifaucium]KZB79771.1 AsnC family transcriptional regulator [Amycolatopsis regifaucium]OKA09912.1 AsnC family transcriptional regulator [Amycolatopsis regifaucium]SFI69831.1 DNA-binding transcriptional regulator, Lrp family [Amycolatopsis regifaucium]
MLDEIDRGLIHALHLDGRAPFSRIGVVLGVSTQTVARRYQRLRSEAGLRVVGLPDPGRAGLTQWIVRLTAQPATARTLARSLAKRPDTSWVKLTSGGTEIVAIAQTPTDSPSAMLLHDIPRTATVTAVSAHLMLHTYLGGPAAWHGRLAALTEEQQEALRVKETAVDQGPLTPADHALIDVLRHDGRMSVTQLAVATGLAPSTVTRRLDDLRASGALFFDVEINAALYGVTTQAFLWMAIAPADLDEVATTLAAHEELAVVAATTGPTNLIAQALCPDPAALHRYLTRRLGAQRAIRTLHTAPVLEIVKAVGPLPA